MLRMRSTGILLILFRRLSWKRGRHRDGDMSSVAGHHYRRGSLGLCHWQEAICVWPDVVLRAYRDRRDIAVRIPGHDVRMVAL